MSDEGDLLMSLWFN